MLNFAIFCIVCILGLVAYVKKPSVKAETKQAQAPVKRIPFEKFELITAINNGAEAQLFHTLLAYAGQWGCHVLVKPRLEDVIRVKRSVTSKEKFALRGRIKSRHLDFLIIDANGRPLAGVELDGPTHNNARVKANDQFKDNLAYSVGLPLHRVLASAEPQAAAYEIFTALYNARQAA